MTATFGTKDPDNDAEFLIDARSAVTVVAPRSLPIAEGAIVKAPRHTGFYYECTTAGETAYGWPETYGKAWPRAEGGTLQDGSVGWTARAPNSDDLPQVESVQWIPDDGISVASERIESGIVYPTVSGGAAGESYSLTARIRWSTGEITDITGLISVSEQ